MTLKDGSQVFRLGGLLKKRHSKYVILSNGTFSWSVQRYHYVEEEEDPVFETVFFRILIKHSKGNRYQHLFPHVHPLFKVPTLRKALDKRILSGHQ